MKRLFAILLTLAMLLSLTACGGSAEEDPSAASIWVRLPRHWV